MPDDQRGAAFTVKQFGREGQGGNPTLAASFALLNPEGETRVSLLSFSGNI